MFVINFNFNTTFLQPSLSQSESSGRCLQRRSSYHCFNYIDLASVKMGCTTRCTVNQHLSNIQTNTGINLQDER